MPDKKLTVADKALIKKYGELFNNTGGNDIVELLERTDANLQNNAVVVLLQVACSAQLALLHALKADGIEL